MPCYTVHAPMPVFRQIDEQDDKYAAMEVAYNYSLSNMQDFVLVMDDEKEVIAIIHRGVTFDKSYSKEDE
jgi:hypothetical protein